MSIIQGTAGNDNLSGTNDNDTLLGGTGNDYLNGGGGNDTYIFNLGDGADTIYDYYSTVGTDAGVADVLRFGAGITKQNIVFSGNQYDVLITFVGYPNDSIRIISQGANYGSAYNNRIESFIFTDGSSYSYNDIVNLFHVYGTESADNLVGSYGNDTMYGYGGNDTISGYGFVPDLIYGGAGNDSIYSTIGTIYGEDGNDTISASGYLDGGSGSDSILGTYNNDTLLGGTGNDYLNGGGGNDTYIFNLGDGADTIYDYYSTVGTDAGVADVLRFGAGITKQNIVFSGNQYDVLITFVGYPNDSIRIISQGANYGSAYNNRIESFIFTDGSSYSYNDIVNLFHVYGTESADNLVGSYGNDTMYGYGGNDTISGYGFVPDLIYGGAGNDSIYSTIGTIYGEDGNDTISASGYLDGGSGSDSILGTYNNDTLLGGTGNDYLNGGGGNDTYIFNLGDGADTIYDYYSTVGTDAGVADVLRFGAGITKQNIVFSRSQYDFLITFVGYPNDSIRIISQCANYGSAYNNRIESFVFADGSSYSYTQILAGTSGNDTLIGTTGNDLLYGNDGNDSLVGLAGDDMLNGGVGNDTMVGGAGNDTYYVDNVGDIVTENANEGTDIVNSSITYTLGSNVENLTMTGTGNINGTGNELNNYIIGNSGNNIIDGGIGNDTMVGGAGNDTYYVNNSGDVVTENASEGTDRVYSSVDYTLSSNLENLNLTGTTAINGIGNGLNNSITGNSIDNNLSGGAGNDVLNGGVGADTLIGGLGNDTYYIDDVGDVIVENINEGIDTVSSSISYELGTNVENLTLTGSTAINGTGNELNNYITGNSGNNIIDGGIGADTLNGGIGNDTLIGGAGNDTYLFKKGDGIDEISDTSGTDSIVFDSSVLKEDLYYLQKGNNLLIKNKTNSDEIIVDNWYSSTNNQIETMQFSDGTPIVVNPTSIPIIEDIDEDTALTLNVLDGYGGQLIIDSFTQGQNGSISINSDNKLVYTPNANYNGSDSFTYTLTDGNGGTLTKTISLTINPVNDAPVATLTAGTLDEDNLLILDVLGNSFDVDGDTLVIDSFTQGTHGTITKNTDGKLVYAPGANYNGADAFDYTISDGNGGTIKKTVNLTINSVNDIPTAVVDAGNLNEDSSLILDVLAGANDADGDTLVIDSFTQGAHGVITKNTDGKLVYTPGVNYNGADTFDYTISDGNGGTVTKTVDLTINSVNDAPVATLITGTLDEDHCLILDVLGNSTDVDGDILNIDSFTQGTNGSITKNEDNKLVYTPNTNYNGTDAFNYTISDGNGGFVTKTVDLTINSVNDSPTATLTADTLDEDNSLILDILGNSSDVDGDILSIDSFTQGTHGTITKNTDGKLVYAPSANYNGADTFDYTISDGNGGTVTKTVNLTINPVNDAPTASLTSGTLEENNSLVLDALAFATDVDGDVLTIDSFTQGVNGNIIKNSENKLVYAPNTNYSGSDAFDYTISDGHGGTVTKTVDLTINSLPINIVGGSGDDILTGNYKDNTLIGSAGDDTILGEAGDDIYIFNLGDGIDNISDSSGTDVISLDSSVNKDQIAVFMQGTDLVVDYGSTIGQDKIVVLGQTNSATAVEKLQLSDGTFISNTDVNQLIQTMTAYATSNGIQLTSVSDVKNNQDLMTMVVNSWHS